MVAGDRACPLPTVTVAKTASHTPAIFPFRGPRFMDHEDTPKRSPGVMERKLLSLYRA